MNGRNIPNSQTAAWIKFLASVVIFPLAGFTFVWLLSLDRRVTVIESNRFTNADGQRLMDKVNGLADRKADKADVPPPVVIERLDNLEDDVAEIKRDVKQLLKR